MLRLRNALVIGGQDNLSKDAVPAAPVASAATELSDTGFTANWGAVAEATGYRLDVSAVSNFASFVTG